MTNEVRSDGSPLANPSYPEQIATLWADLKATEEALRVTRAALAWALDQLDGYDERDGAHSRSPTEIKAREVDAQLTSAQEALRVARTGEPDYGTYQMELKAKLTATEEALRVTRDALEETIAVIDVIHDPRFVITEKHQARLVQDLIRFRKALAQSTLDG